VPTIAKIAAAMNANTTGLTIVLDPNVEPAASPTLTVNAVNSRPSVVRSNVSMPSFVSPVEDPESTAMVIRGTVARLAPVFEV